MSYYQVILEGKNFYVTFNETTELVGFFTTRWVKAKSTEEAEIFAVNLIKKDSSLMEISRNVERAVSPSIFLSEISTVSWFTYFRKKPGRGYSFFKQNS